MNNLFVPIYLASLLAATGHPVRAQDVLPVTVDNFVRAETDFYFGDLAVRRGFLGKFYHYREPAPVEQQVVVRPNRDVIVSAGVFDLDAGALTITLPDAGKRFRSMLVIDQNHYNPLITYEPGDHTLVREKIGTRYIEVLIRTLADPNDPKDMQAVHALQDATKVTQPGGPGRFEVPSWDQASQKKIRDALLVLASTLPDLRHAFGARDQVDPVRHLIGAAAGWGGNPDRDATYLNITPERNDGKTIYRLTVKEVPVDSFWSISLYNAQGYFVKNEFNAYNVNSVTAKRSTDGAVVVQFGGCDGKIPNCLPIMAGWNYLVRLYRPRAEILDGTWKFPEAQPLN